MFPVAVKVDFFLMLWFIAVVEPGCYQKDNE